LFNDAIRLGLTSTEYSNPDNNCEYDGKAQRPPSHCGRADVRNVTIYFVIPDRALIGLLGHLVSGLMPRVSFPVTTDKVLRPNVDDVRVSYTKGTEEQVEGDENGSRGDSARQTATATSRQVDQKGARQRGDQQQAPCLVVHVAPSGTRIVVCLLSILVQIVYSFRQVFLSIERREGRNLVSVFALNPSLEQFPSAAAAVDKPQQETDDR
jgi:hypothetical protein